MTRSEFIQRLTERLNHPTLGLAAELQPRDCEMAVRLMLQSMSEALVEGNRIEIRGFGSFSVTERPPRIGRNPRSGETVEVPAKRVPHFKPGKELRYRVDKAAQAQQSQASAVSSKAQPALRPKIARSA